MAVFPRIQSPCPYKDRLGEVMQGDFCRMCERQVHDITAMSDAERIALVAGCKDEICVSYSLTAKTALAAAALGAAFGMPAAAAAQDASAAVEDESYSMEIIVGGLKAPKDVAWVEAKRPANLAELPVVYETGTSDATPAPAAEEEDDVIIIVAGGLRKPAEGGDQDQPTDLARLPVIEEDAAGSTKPVSSAS